MKTTPIQAARREAALDLLAEFQQRILPGALRRIATWKGLSRQQVRDLAEDIAHELVIDCLTARDTIVSLPARERHARWLRLAERWIYRQLVRPGRRLATCEPDTLPAQRHHGPATEAVPDHIVQLKNGRCNLTATARRRGVDQASVRRELEGLARDFGLDRDNERFWQQRLAEALTGLAADLLRHQRPLHCLTSLPEPDPEARAGRIRRLARRFGFHVTAPRIRRILTPWRGAARPDAVAPRELLQQAVLLAPEQQAGWLWLFESTHASGDARAAVTALRQGRRCRVRSPGAFTLARARLLEARGRWPAALALLQRARRRWPGDGLLRAAQTAINATSA